MAEDWSHWNDEIVDANRRIIEEFRANDGQVGGYFTGAPMLLLHHLGARSGIERITPLVYLPDGDDLVVSASKGGAQHHPDWYHNLVAHPQVVIEIGMERVTVEAVEVSGTERDRLYGRLAAMRPAFAGYQTRTDRIIPMFRLVRSQP